MLRKREFQALRGRVGALELLTAQSLVLFLKCVPDDERDGFVADALIQLENRFERFNPLAARAALDCADALWSSALATVRQPGVEG